MKKKKYNKLTAEEIQKAYEFQKEKLDWTFYSEREFIENLLTNRFNFLLVAYSLFVTAFATIEGKTNKIIILSLGLLITFFISITIYRVYQRHILNLKILYDLGDQHVFPFISKELKSKHKNVIKNVNPILGIILPLIFMLTFIAAIILIGFDLWIF
ncbi:MAG: hypothetical protein EOP54_14980 [Sphingobacteriales bacterium]|nr:MAG: hypothetical protein EOP54_14980 [Sphingobacteriales bacterium]